MFYPALSVLAKRTSPRSLDITPMTATKLDKIRSALYADLERGLVRINQVLIRIADFVPEDCYVHFDVQADRITIEGERTCPENLQLLLAIAKEFGETPCIHYIADGWDGTIMTKHAELVCIWVTNVSDPNGPRPKL